MSAQADFALKSPAIETRSLTRLFGDTEVVSTVTLEVKRGSVFALLGVNGAGKSTFIKMLIGHLHPTSGSFRILGREPSRDLLEIRRRVGYVSEDRYLYDWMTVSEIVAYTRAFHMEWDDTKCSDLLRRFGLTPHQRVGALSRGHRARLCLTLALSYNPELIILDEPTSGLDPIARRDLMENIIQELGEEGRTVLLSSHLVDEVERIADCVGIMHQGRLILCSGLDDLKSSVRRIRIPAGSWPGVDRLPNLLRRETWGSDETLTLRDFEASLLDKCGLREKSEFLPLTLEEIFVSLVRHAGPAEEGI